jgi:hypothetical protein
VKVVDPDGTDWTVRRRWLPRYEGRGLRERLRQRRARSAGRQAHDVLRWYDRLGIPFADDSLTAVIVSLLVIGGLILLVLFGIPALLALVDLALVLAVTAAGLIGRLLFRRPWTVEARATTGDLHEAHVVGWRRAGELAAAMARSIENGASLGPGRATPT